MLAYILGSATGSKGITKRYRFWGLQIVARSITNKGNLNDFKLGQKDIKSKQRLQIGA